MSWPRDLAVCRVQRVAELDPRLRVQPVLSVALPVVRAEVEHERGAGR